MVQPSGALITICIPTYNRLPLLLEAIASCAAQTIDVWEIAISDDSTNDETEKAIADHALAHRIQYVHNRPALRQAANVNQLFGMVRTPYLLLLHDDDILMPTALEVLLPVLEKDGSLVAAFGKQYLMANDGTLLLEESKKLSLKYFKTEETANRRQRGFWSALVQQFPNDAYLVRTEAARAVRYRDLPEIGGACDADFGYRLAEHGDFYFADEYTAAYRLTDSSISSTGLKQSIARMYFLIRELRLPPDLEPVRDRRLREIARTAMTGWMLEGESRKAFVVWASAPYGWKRRASPKGIVQLVSLVMPRRFVQRLAGMRG